MFRRRQTRRRSSEGSAATRRANGRETGARETEMWIGSDVGSVFGAAIGDDVDFRLATASMPVSDAAEDFCVTRDPDRSPSAHATTTGSPSRAASACPVLTIARGAIALALASRAIENRSGNCVADRGIRSRAGGAGRAGRLGSACGHARPKTRRSEAEHRRQFAAGVGPRGQWKELTVFE